MAYLSDVQLAALYDAIGKLTPNVSADEWGRKLGLRNVATFADNNTIAANTTASSLLNYGWQVAAGMTVSEFDGGPVTGDINSAADDATQNVLLDAASDYLFSPNIIGGYHNIQLATVLLGAAPTTITCGIIGRFVSTTSNQIDGFMLAGGAHTTYCNNAANLGINIGAANFSYNLEGGAQTSLGVAVDTSVHRWEFVITISSRACDIKIDGTVRATVTLAEDLWPKRLGAGVVTPTNNLGLAAMYVIYS